VLTIISIILNKVKRAQIVALAVLGAIATLICGALFALAEHVSVWIGLYWAVTTATTVGYGDVTPHNAAGRIIAVVTMLTTIPLFGGAFAMLAAVFAAARLTTLLGVEWKIPTGGHVAIYGMGPVVPLLAGELLEAGKQVVVVADGDSSALPLKVHHFQGDPTEESVVRKSQPEKAERSLVLGERDSDVLLTTVLLRHLAPLVPVVAVTDSAKVAEALSDLGVSRTISAEHLIGHTLAKSLETPHAADLLVRLIATNGYRLDEIDLPPELVGEPISVIRHEERVEGLILGAVHDGEVVLGVGRDPALASGDHLLVVRLTGH